MSHPHTLASPSGAIWLDHVLLGTPDVAATAATITEALGVTFSGGGTHRGLGTHNVVLGLGGVYLEVIGPTDDDPDFSGDPRWFGLDDLTAARVVAYSTGVADIERQVARARERGWDPGDIVSQSRDTPDGGSISWRRTQTDIDFHGGVVPFLVEWKDSPSPADSLPPEARLESLALSHPDRERVRAIHDALELSHLDVAEGPAAATITLTNGDRSITF